MIWFCSAAVWLCGMLQAEKNATADLPDVYLLLEDGGPLVEPMASPHWRVPGKLTNAAALLYGRTPLECGVVSDLDWRRKPVRLASLADYYRDAGHHTIFLGHWGMGLEAPYDPASRGFESVWMPAGLPGEGLDAVGKLESQAMEPLVRAMPADQPWFCMIRQGGMKPRPAALLERLRKAGNRSDRPGIVCKISSKGVELGRVGAYAGELPKLPGRAVWELTAGLLSVIGQKPDPTPEFLFYHEGGWPLTDSPEKYRHKGCAVVGRGVMLTDGLELFAIDADGKKLKPLDLAGHAEMHRRLLTAHGRWWNKVHPAVNDPRSFDVGGEGDPSICRLSAHDWRPTRIVHPDGSALASGPMASMSLLLATLKGLRDDEDYKQSFPAYSGSWSLNLKRSGRYQITARLLPEKGVKEKDRNLGRLRGGRAHVRLGRNEVQLRIQEGAEAVTVLVDAEAGVTDLECWFTGQLALERELGAFFVQIERVGEKKFQFKVAPDGQKVMEKP